MQFEYKNNSAIRSCTSGSLSAGDEVTVTLEAARATALGLPETFVAQMVSVTKVDCKYCYIFEVTDPLVLASGITLKQCDFDENFPIECYSCCDSITDNFAQLMADAFNDDPALNAGIKQLIEDCLGDPTSELALSIKSLIEACIADPTSELAIAFKDLITACLTNESADISTAIGAAFKAAIEACLTADGADGTTVVGSALKAAIEACLNADASDVSTVVGAATKNAVITCLTQAVNDPTSDSALLFKQIIENCLSNDGSDLATVVGQSLKAAVNSCLVAAAANPTGPAAESVKTLIETCISADSTDVSTPVGAAIKDAILACIQSALADPSSDTGLALKEFIENCITSDSADVNTAVGAAIKEAIQVCLADAANDPSSLAGDSLKSIVENCLSSDASDTNSIAGAAIKDAILACIQSALVDPSSDTGLALKEFIENCITSDSADVNTAVGAAIKEAIQVCLADAANDPSSLAGDSLKSIVENCLSSDASDTNSVVGGAVKAAILACLATQDFGPTDAEVKTLIEQCLADAAADPTTAAGQSLKTFLESCLAADAADSNTVVGGAIKDAIEDCLVSDGSDDTTPVGTAIKDVVTACIDDIPAVTDQGGLVQTAISLDHTNSDGTTQSVALATFADWQEAASADEVGLDKIATVGSLAPALRVNDAANSIALGVGAGENSTAINQSATGAEAGRNNAGAQQTVVGVNAGQNNVGRNQCAFGVGSGQNNTGINNSAFGNTSMVDIFTDNNSGFGALSANNSILSNTAVTVNALSGDSVTLSTPVPASVGSTVALVVTNSTISNLGNFRYAFTVVSPTSLKVVDGFPLTFGTSGSASARVIARPQYSNNTYLGHRSAATASNQAVVGNDTQTPVGYAPFTTISDQRDKLETSFSQAGHGLDLIDNIPIRAFKLNHRSRYTQMTFEDVEFENEELVSEFSFSQTAQETVQILAENTDDSDYLVEIKSTGVTDNDEYIEFVIDGEVVARHEGLTDISFELLPNGSAIEARYVVGDTSANTGERYDVALKKLTTVVSQVESVETLENDGSLANEQEQLGYFAQEIQQAAQTAGVAQDYIVRDMAQEGGEDILMVNDQALIAELILANQQLLARVEQLENA